LANSKPKRQRPKTKLDRARLCQINTLLNNSRTPDAQRAELEAERDLLAPVVPFPIGSLLGNEDSKPTTADNLALCARVEVARKTAAVSSPVFMSDPAGHRERARLKAANATPAEKAAALLADLPDHPLNKLARELAQYIWNEDRSNPRPSVSAMAAGWVQHWLSDALYNRHDLRGNRTTVDAALSNALKLVGDLDSADPNWYVRRAEKLLNTQPALTKPPAAHEALQTAERVRTTPIPSSTQPDEPTLNPIERANIDLAARAALVSAN